MLPLTEIKALLRDRNLAEVARQSGVHRNTIYRLMHGAPKPSYATVSALSVYLTGRAA